MYREHHARPVRGPPLPRRRPSHPRNRFGGKWRRRFISCPVYCFRSHCRCLINLATRHGAPTKRVTIVFRSSLLLLIMKTAATLSYLLPWRNVTLLSMRLAAASCHAPCLEVPNAIKFLAIGGAAFDCFTSSFANHLAVDSPVGTPRAAVLCSPQPVLSSIAHFSYWQPNGR